MFLLTISGFSQIKYGVKGGMNLSDISQGIQYSGESINQDITIVTGGSTQQSSITTTNESINETVYVSTSPKISFYVGGFIEFPLNKRANLYIKTELLYCQNGANVANKSENTNQYIDYTSNGGYYTVGQLNMPLLVKFVTQKKIAFIGGCYFGTILSAKAVSNDGETNNLKSGIKSFDFGLEIGTSYQVNKKISIELIYNRGIINLDVFKENYGNTEISGFYYNRSLHLGVEYQF